MTIRDFSGGLNTSHDIGVIPENQFSVFKNVRPDSTGRLSAEYPMVQVKELANNAYKASRYQSDGKFRLLLHAWESDTNKLRYYDEENGGAEVLISTGTTLPADELFVPSMVALSDRYMYITDPYGPLQVYFPNVPDDLAIPAGVDPPASTPIPTTSNSGVLDTTGKTIPYFEWRLTYYTVTNIESNPADSTGKISGIVLKKAEFTIPNPNTAFGRLLIAKGFIYRRGGSSSSWIRVGEVVFEDPDTPGYATSETFIDNTTELDLGSTIMPTNNYKPPTGLDVIYIHKNRMFAASSRGFGTSETPTRLWVSGLNQLEVFGVLDSGSATEGGYITLPGGDDDCIKTLCSTGSILIIGRRRSIYALFGSSLSNFALSPRSLNIGVASRDGMCRGYNEVYFLGTDRRVYRVAESDPEWISQNIQEELDSLYIDNIYNAKLRFADGSLFMSFSGSFLGVSSCYKLSLKSGMPRYWERYDIGSGSIAGVESVPHFSYDYSEPVEGAQDDDRITGEDELLVVLEGEFSNPGPPVNGITVNRVLSRQHGIVDIDVDIRKDVIQDGAFGYATLRASHVYVEGSYEASGPPGLQVKVYADDTVFTYDLPESATISPLANLRLPLHIVGKVLSVRLVGTVVSMDIRVVRLEYSYVRSH